MLHTRICDLLGVYHPIISAPMANAAGAELASAVSEAGEFGMIGGSSGNDPGWLRDQIRLVRERTDRPFGVGFISSRPGQESLFQVALEEQVVAICYSFADLTPYVPAAHEAGVKVVAQVQKVSHARIAALAGVDIIVAQGSEAGGHTGYNGTLPMVPSVIDVAGDIPVVAAGGIADGRGLASVLMLWAVKFSAPSFSYQAILSSNMDALRTSMSPSPSTSAANTLLAALAFVLMVCGVKFSLPSFSYQAILLS